MEKLSTTTLLIALSVLLASCGGSSAPGSQVSLTDVAQAAARQEDRVSVEQLAAWLVEEKQDFVLIDVRSSLDFEKGQIGDAENVPLAELVTAASLEGLPQDRKIVLYSNGSENAAKGEVMLRLAGFDAHLLAGGYNAWHQRILNPDISADELDGESLQISAQRALSCYFVGERSGQAAKRASQADTPFVPPVYVEQDELLEPPASSGEESC
jgi:rhodanese-related sulfurtransferase